VPTSVPFSLYAKNTKDYEPSAKENLTIGWIGNGPAHYENLQILVSVFRKLLQDKVLFKFILIGSLKNDKIHRLFKKIEGLDSNIIDELDWGNPENISREIKRFDLGLMPLVDNKWNRGKCAFKAIEYMACGVPPIISPVGENKHLVSHGVNGFLASDTEDWIEAIKKIDQDRSLIFVMGRKAQETIRAGYSFETSIPKIIKIIEGIK
jgi:glycosyltransferase involved in cell wall biosynthesis